MVDQIQVGNVIFGGDELVIIAGPCAVESRDQLFKIAEQVKIYGAHFLRGGAYKPRTKGGDWEGLKEEGLEILAQAKEQFELGIVTEILDGSHIHLFQQYGIDMYQVGARNAQNQALLNALGAANVPVLLKNGMATTINEWLGSASRIPEDKCVLCSRGKEVDQDVARNSVDLVALAHVVNNTDYPIVFDPSHSTGRRDLVYNVCMGAVATGVDGLIVEVHNNPEMAVTDGKQSILPKEFRLLVEDAKKARAAFLDRQDRYTAYMKKVHLPTNATIYFRAEQLPELENILGTLTTSNHHRPTPLDREGMTVSYARMMHILKATIDAGYIGKLLKNGYATGKLARTSEGETNLVHIIVSEKGKTKLNITPYSASAVHAGGGRTSVEAKQFKRRVEFTNACPGDRIRDGIITYEGLPGGLGKIVIYENNKPTT